MTQEHPDELLTQLAVKAITRGSRQAADDRAMEAYWQALEGGKSIAEAKEIFSDTYKKCLNGNRKED